MKFKNPPVNSLSLEFLTEFVISLEKLENDKTFRGVILTSVGAYLSPPHTHTPALTMGREQSITGHGAPNTPDNHYGLLGHCVLRSRLSADGMGCVPGLGYPCEPASSLCGNFVFPGAT